MLSQIWKSKIVDERRKMKILGNFIFEPTNPLSQVLTFVDTQKLINFTFFNANSENICVDKTFAKQWPKW